LTSLTIKTILAAMKTIVFFTFISFSIRWRLRA
jgi:hypothetical protein